MALLMAKRARQETRSNWKSDRSADNCSLPLQNRNCRDFITASQDWRNNMHLTLKHMRRTFSGIPFGTLSHRDKRPVGRFLPAYLTIQTQSTFASEAPTTGRRLDR